MELVRRYTEINRRAKEEAANGDDRREKSWFTKKGSSVLLRTKMAMRKRREQGERAPQSTFPSRGARVSVETRDSHPGWTTDGGLVRRGHLPAELNPLRPSVLYTDIAHGVGPQKMHPEIQPLSSRAHSYSILALCFSTSVILVDDYIVGMLARPQPRTESRRDSRTSRSIAL